MNCEIGNRRLWLFRSLVAVTAGLMLTSAILPWWTCTIDVPYVGTPKPSKVEIYQYGLSHDLVQLKEYVEADETPFYQNLLAWVYIAASVGLILYSTWLKGRKGKWLLGGIGLIYIAYAAIAVIWIAVRTGDFSISLLGPSETQHEMVDVTITVFYFASLKVGFYLAYAAGGMCILLALFRNKIIGSPKLSEQWQVISSVNKA